VCVASELAHVLALHRRQLDAFLGTASAGLASRGAVVGVQRAGAHGAGAVWWGEAAEESPGRPTRGIPSGCCRLSPP
jgi:hypothetical protein